MSFLLPTNGLDGKWSNFVFQLTCVFTLIEGSINPDYLNLLHRSSVPCLEWKSAIASPGIASIPLRVASSSNANSLGTLITYSNPRAANGRSR